MWMLEMNCSHVKDHLLTMSPIYSPLPLHGDYIDYSEGYMYKVSIKLHFTKYFHFYLMCVCTYVCLVPKEIIRGLQILWNWS